MNDSCLFCRNVERLGSIGDLLFEDDRCAAVLHEDWSVAGHAMLIWKRHVENISDLSEQDAAHLSKIHHAVEKNLLHATGAGRVIVMKLGIAVPHLHVHLYPVSAALDRAQVMAIIDGKTRVERDEVLIATLRRALSP
jgi:histidine triad (HIT) family protein